VTGAAAPEATPRRSGTVVVDDQRVAVVQVDGVLTEIAIGQLQCLEDRHAAANGFVVGPGHRRLFGHQRPGHRPGGGAVFERQDTVEATFGKRPRADPAAVIPQVDGARAYVIRQLFLGDLAARLLDHADRQLGRVLEAQAANDFEAGLGDHRGVVAVQVARVDQSHR